MALPPAWLGVVAALNATEHNCISQSQRAQEMVAYLEAHGLRVVPSYCVVGVETGLGIEHDDTQEQFRALSAAGEPVNMTLSKEEFLAGLKQLYEQEED